MAFLLLQLSAAVITSPLTPSPAGNAPQLQLPTYVLNLTRSNPSVPPTPTPQELGKSSFAMARTDTVKSAANTTAWNRRASCRTLNIHNQCHFPKHIRGRLPVDNFQNFSSGIPCHRLAFSPKLRCQRLLSLKFRREHHTIILHDVGQVCRAVPSCLPAQAERALTKCRFDLTRFPPLYYVWSCPPRNHACFPCGLFEECQLVQRPQLLLRRQRSVECDSQDHDDVSASRRTGDQIDWWWAIERLAVSFRCVSRAAQP